VPSDLAETTIDAEMITVGPSIQGQIIIIIIIIIIILLKVLHSQGTWKLAKCSVCVRDGYDGDSEIVNYCKLLLLLF